MPIQTANAAIAQLGERQTEDLEVPSSILGCGILFFTICWPTLKQRRTPGSCRKTQNPGNVSTNKVFTNQSSLTTLQEIPILLHERHRASLTRPRGRVLLPPLSPTKEKHPKQKCCALLLKCACACASHKKTGQGWKPNFAAAPTLTGSPTARCPARRAGHRTENHM